MSHRLVLYIDCKYHRRSYLQNNLKSMGFEVHTASTVQAAREMVENFCYSLVLICFELVSKEIFRLCSFIRSRSPCAVVIVLMTKVRIRIEEQLFDCGVGVNDVVAGRQTSSHVLSKRVLAHLRNNKAFWSESNCIRLKDTIIDLDRREVQINGKCRQLRGILADLLKYFLDNPNHVISREELQESPIWSDSICTPAKEGGKTFDVNVGKLRKIIEPDPSQPQIIKSVRGLGWKISMESVK